MKPSGQASTPLLDKLRGLRGPKTVIVGLGNTLKGNDAAGCLLCERIAGKVSAPVVNAGAVAENYIQHIKKCKPENVLVVDAVDFGAAAGSIEMFTRERIDSFTVSTHVVSPRLFADIIAGDVYFVGIQPAHTNLGQRVSAEVDQAVETLAAILSELFPP